VHIGSHRPGRSGQRRHLAVADVRLKPVAVELDLVDPAWAGRWLALQGGQCRLDESGEGRLRHHTVHVANRRHWTLYQVAISQIVGAVGVCADKKPPAAFFPAHWAPNDLKFYTASAFPKVYRGGAFVAFHGSWNRAPGPQGGYNVVFQPFADGKASGKYVVFADGFAGAVKEPGRATYRPSGLAIAPDGALFVWDDVTGASGA
jgi:hypothetical protein